MKPKRKVETRGPMRTRGATCVSITVVKCNNRLLYVNYLGNSDDYRSLWDRATVSSWYMLTEKEYRYKCYVFDSLWFLRDMKVATLTKTAIWKRMFLVRIQVNSSSVMITTRDAKRIVSHQWAQANVTHIRRLNQILTATIPVVPHAHLVYTKLNSVPLIKSYNTIVKITNNSCGLLLRVEWQILKIAFSQILLTTPQAILK